jgi:hypothetical protein
MQLDLAFFARPNVDEEKQIERDPAMDRRRRFAGGPGSGGFARWCGGVRRRCVGDPETPTKTLRPIESLSRI